MSCILFLCPCSRSILAVLSPHKTLRTIAIASDLGVEEIKDSTPLKTRPEQEVQVAASPVHFLANSEPLPDLHGPPARRDAQVMSLQETLVSQAVYTNVQNIKQEDLAEIAGKLTQG